MTTETEPQDRPEIQTTDDLLAAVRMGMEIATRSDIAESERRMMGRVGELFDAQNKRINARFDAQDKWRNSFETRLIKNTAASRAPEASVEPYSGSVARTIRWVSLAIGALGALTAILVTIATLLGN